MKRPFMFRLVSRWCLFYSIIMFFSAYKALYGVERVGGVKVILGILPFGAMLGGTIGVYNAQRWGAWLSAATLGLLTAWLPLGYKLLISKGGHPGPLLVIFAGLATANIVATVYLVRLAYHGYVFPDDEKPKSSS